MTGSAPFGKPFDSGRRPDGHLHLHLVERRPRKVVVKGASQVPVGTYILVGSHVGILDDHTGDLSSVRIEAQFVDDALKGPQTAVDPHSIIRPFAAEDWNTYLRRLLGNRRIEYGRIRQEGVSAPCRVAPFNGHHTVVFGATGAGKTTTLLSAVVQQCNQAREFAKRSGQPAVGYLCLDSKGDFGGFFRDEENNPLPNLLNALAEPPDLFGPDDIACGLHDIDLTLLTKCMGKMSASQYEWINTYLTGDDAVRNLRLLLDDQSRWAEAFDAWSIDGKLPSNKLQCLVTLRGKFKSVVRPPLFKEVGDGNWRDIIDRLYQGRCVVVSLNKYDNDAQRQIVASLFIRHLLDRQRLAVDSNQPCFPLVVACPEAHLMRDCFDSFEKLWRLGRAFNIGGMTDSQQPADFPDVVLDCTRTVIALRLDGKAPADAVNRWPVLRPHRHELSRLAPGTGFIVTHGTALPVGFVKPPILR